MTQQNGGQDGGSDANANDQQNQQNQNQNNGGSNANADLEKQLEAVRAELSSRDKKIAEMLKLEEERKAEAEKQRQASLTAEQKLDEAMKKLDRHDKLTNFVSLGYTGEQAQKLVDAPDAIEFAKLTKEFTENNAVENFKKTITDNVPPAPNPKENVDPKQSYEETFKDVQKLM